MSRYKQGHERLFTYDSEIKAPLLDLLHSFGPQRKTQYPNMPFWRLQGDGFWQLLNTQDCINPNNTNKEPSCKRYDFYFLYQNYPIKVRIVDLNADIKTISQRLLAIIE